MACSREARVRHNTIAFWLSDDEKAKVEARIILSGLPKGEYYRRAIMGEEINVVAGTYLTQRVVLQMEKLYQDMSKNNDTNAEKLLIELLKELLELKN
jgi:hypothetical protein